MTGSDLKETFARLHLNTLPSEWVEAAWKGDFTPPPELPAEYELQLDHDLRDLLRNAREALRVWADTPEDDMSSEYSRSRVSDSEEEDDVSNASFASKGRSWRGLGALISRRPTVALVSAVIALGAEEDPSEEDRDRSVAGARLYLTMLSISGAHVFGVFNSTVFEQAVCLLNSATLLVAIPMRGKGRKKAMDDAPIPLTPVERRALTARLTGVLDDIGPTLNNLPLRNHPASASVVASALMAAAKAPPFVSRATELLERLCTPAHGDAARDVARLALPAIGTDPTLVHLLGRLAKEPSTCNKIEALVQQVLLCAPDKADARSRAAATAVDLSAQLPETAKTDFIFWLACLCHADAVKHRLIGIDAVLHLLNLRNYCSPISNLPSGPSSPLRVSNSGNSDDPCAAVDNHVSSPGNVSKDPGLDGSFNSPSKNSESMDTADSSPASSPSKRKSKSSVASSGPVGPSLSTKTGHQILFGALLNRCQDNSPRVRTKALGYISSLILSREMHIRCMVQQVFLESGPRKEFFDFQQFFKKKNKNALCEFDALPSVDTVLELLRAGADDDKVFVRKNSLHALANVMFLDQRFITPQLVNLLMDSCRDLAVSVRKMVIQCLTDILLNYPTHDLLPAAWVGGVVPLMSDNDNRVQEKALEVVEQVILHNMVPEYKSQSPVLQLPWKLISLITTMDMRKVFKYACQHWSAQKKISTQFFTSIQSYIGGSNTLAAWYFLENLCEFQEMPKPDFLVDYFYENILESSQVEEVCAKLVLRCILLNWSSITPERRNLLASQLQYKLDHFVVPIALISSALDIVWKNDAEAAKPWAVSLIKAVEENIVKKIESLGEDEVPDHDDPSLCRLIFLLGDLAHLAPDVVSNPTIAILSNLIDISGWEKDRLERDSGRTHAVAIATLGKLCLQNHITAKSLVPLLGALVAAPAPSIIKINACIALSDLCVRFSSLVEPYFGDMCVCLRDPDPSVRKNTLSLISYLVLEDFLKLKVPVFIYLMSMMKDSVMEIKDTASSFIVNSILHKNPHVMNQHFIPVMMFLNDYKATESVSPQEKETFCLCGEENATERREIYCFMLNFMRGDMKIRAKYRLCLEVLEPISEGTLALDETGTSILKDCLYVMGCEEIRLSGRNRNTPDDEDEDMETVQAAKNVVYNELFDNLSRKILTESVVPAIIKLKRKLMSLKSPLVEDLMICLRDNLKDYKDQVEEILAADPDVAAEVVHDLREMENARKGINSSPDGPSSQPPDQDTLMIEMTRVAKRISINVMEHGTGIITAQAEDDPTETPRPLRSSTRPSASPRRVSTNSNPGRRESVGSDSTRRSQAKRRQSRKSSMRVDDDSDSDSPLPRGRRQRGATPAGSSPPTSVSSLSSFSSSASRKS